MITESDKLRIKSGIEKVKENMARAAERKGLINDAILLLATKTRTPEEINYAISCGVMHIGENRVQELLSKYDEIDKDNVVIHFIGALQTNKVKYIIDKVDLIQSVDRLSLAKEIDKEAKKHNKTMDVLLEINIGGEESKSGIAPSEALNLAKEIGKLTSLRLKGVMAVPPADADEKQLRIYFKKIIEIFIDIRKENIDNSNMQILSFGMSGDYEIAIEEGSNMIRVGTAVFGERDYSK